MSWLAIAVPYLPEIIHLARPLFTRNKNQDKVPEVVVQQISELQSAVTANVDNIAKLAAEMQKTIDALQLGAEALEKKLHRAHLLNIVALTMAALAFCVAVYALAQ
ncbi:MAG TPA: hypothetical protein VFX01_06450 [Methylophilaceae bacterium]|nr:hypothetical protein [Methylophilaceae bacterium]